MRFDRIKEFYQLPSSRALLLSILLIAAGVIAFMVPRLLYHSANPPTVAHTTSASTLAKSTPRVIASMPQVVGSTKQVPISTNVWLSWASKELGCTALLGQPVQRWDAAGNEDPDYLVTTICKAGDGFSFSQLDLFGSGSTPNNLNHVQTLVAKPSESEDYETQLTSGEVIESVAVRNSSITITAEMKAPSDPAACNSLQSVQTFTWASDQFVAGQPSIGPLRQPNGGMC